MAQSETIERILDAAAALFSERGFAETSLRTITSTAGVNLAAVNYHFGSKKSLIQAVFARVLEPFCLELDRQLDELSARPEPLTTHLLVECLSRSLLISLRDHGGKPEQFMRLLGLAYTQSQEHLRQFIIANYAPVHKRFTGLLHETLPHVEPDVFYWRLYFMLGASIFTLASFDSISAILKKDFNKDSNVEETAELLVSAISGMFAAE